jgi:hypothetical protein
MNGKLIIAILVIAAVPVCAQAQKPSAATVTKTLIRQPCKAGTICIPDCLLK